MQPFTSTVTRAAAAVRRGRLSVPRLIAAAGLVFGAGPAAQAAEETCTDFSGGSELQPGQVVDVGLLCGYIFGDTENPPIINTAIAEGTELESVVLGEKAVLPADPTSVELTNVDFASNATIPVGTPLTQALGSAKFGEYSWKLDLSQSVLQSPVPLIEQLRDLSPHFRQGKGLFQNEQGHLEVRIGDKRYELDPASVIQESHLVNSSYKQGVFEVGVNVLGLSGEVVFQTALGRTVSTRLVVAGWDQLEQALAPLGMSPSMSPQDPLVLEDAANGQALYAFYPGLAREPADAGARPGISALPHANHPDYTQYRHVFSEDGQLWQQMFYPAVLNWPFVRGMVFRQTGKLPNFLPDGSLEATLPSGEVVRVMPGPLRQSENPPELPQLSAAGDLNGDGAGDFIASFPFTFFHLWDGTEQVLYRLPED